MTQQVHNTVFISYRRSTSSYLARAIYMDLKQHGYDVFMDVQSIDSGQFDQVILRQIEARAHFLILCTPGTFDRINDPGDWLRREIEHAMLHGRNIVPILASDFKFDVATTQRFTGKLAELPRYNAINVPYDYFEEALERLRSRFLKLPLGVSITITPVTDIQVVAAKKAEVESQPKPSQRQLTAEEYYTRGVENYHKRIFDEALSDFAQAILLNPQYPDAYIYRGLSRYATKDYEGAIEDYTEALYIDPQNALAYFNRGLTRHNNGHLNAAIQDYTEVIHLNPQYVEAYLSRGIVLYHKCDYEGALADYNEVLRLDPQNIVAYINRGLVRHRNHEYDGAIADYTEALRLNPQSANAYNNRGYTKIFKGDFDGAIRDANKSIELGPENSAVYDTRAEAYARKGKYAEAIADFEKYLELGGGEKHGRTAEVEDKIRELKQKLGIK